MAIASDGIMKTARRAGTSSRNVAILSTIGVMGGAVLVFNYLLGGQEIVTPTERLAVRGAKDDPSTQTDQGTNKSAPRVVLHTRNER